MNKAERPDLPAFEAETLKLWRKEKTFEKSLERRKGAKRFSFYDGPPFANGLPHYGHVVPVTLKDAITRYKTMRGYYVPRRLGWDTHGLPVEYEVEKQLGISGKRQIVEMGVDKFNEACRVSVFKYKQDFEDFFDRIGRWADKENSYATLDPEYIESVWWVFAEIYKKKLVYKDFKSMPYCPRCATPLSNFELNQGYKDDVEDPSVFVTFPLADDPETALLAWTTTPWTLPANAALAVQAEADYVTVETKDYGKLILANDRLEVLDLRKSEYRKVGQMKGRDLIGKKYQALYSESDDKTAYTIYDADFVSLEDGTGILHVAPAYGEDDLNLGQKEKLPLIQSVDAGGMMIVDPAKGKFFKNADEHIVADLTQKGRVFAAETFRHTYPFCWRCETPLLYYATPSWFVAVSKFRDKMVKNNQEITWVPAHIKQGRFGNWLADARDWSISRNRFWGAPIPVWECADEHYTVVGSIKELKSKASNPDKIGDLHRPYVDDVILICDDCGKDAKRVEQVFDCWFESGSMPYAQDHYPFENKESVEANFPAEFIAEGLDQTRGWFYTLQVLATALFNKPAYQNVICHGIVLAADGKKLSKRLRNYPPLEEVFDKYGADTLRLFMLSSPVVAGEDVRFSADVLTEVHRNFFLTMWNVYSFFTTYAEIDNWEAPNELTEPKSDNLLDLWMISRLNQAIAECTQAADKYEAARAVRPIQVLMEDLSNWYVRRSRRRFWKTEDDKDKVQAYLTLHYVLARTSQLLAPWAPFVSDKIFRNLMNDSVHLTDWPKAGKVDSQLLEQMDSARKVVQEGLAQRGEAKLKVRQPLADLKFYVPTQLPAELLIVIAEEVNVKSAQQEGIGEFSVKLNTEITHDLKQEGLAREVIRHIQQLRKEIDLNVDDRIKLSLGTDDSELLGAISTHSDLIKHETLADSLSESPEGETKEVLVGKHKLMIGVRK